jgi:membrane-associated protease RseP (regulator of RpoE activity)
MKWRWITSGGIPSKASWPIEVRPFFDETREDAMIRLELALSFAMLALFFAPPQAPGQDTPPKQATEKPDPLAGTRTDVATEDVLIGLDAGVSSAFELIQGQDQKEKAQTEAVVSDMNKALTRLYQTRARSFDALETNFGLKLADADDALRSQLELPPNQGVVVIAVKPGSLAEHAGLKTNDVFVSLGDQKATDVASAKKVLLGLGQGALEVKLIREGKPSRMSLVGPDHGFPPEAAQYWLGVPVSPVDATLRAHLPSLAAEAGLIVNDVVKGSPADTAGVQKNDILVSIGGQPLKTADHMIEQIQASAGKPVPLEILRAGKPMTLTVTPAKRTHPTTINVTGARNLQYRLIAPQIGVETTPESNKPVPPVFLHSAPYMLQQPQLYGSGPIDLQLHLRGNPAKPDDSTARIEAQLAEMSSKLDAIRKILDGLKKPESK